MAHARLGMLLASSLLFAACAAAPRDEFDALRLQAAKDSQVPEGRAYERNLYPAIGQDLANLLKKCSADFPGDDVGSFELAFRIDHWGEPKAVFVRPLTDLSQCVARGFWYFPFPHPDEKFAQTGLVLLLPIRIR